MGVCREKRSLFDHEKEKVPRHHVESAAGGERKKIFKKRGPTPLLIPEGSE